MRTAPAQGSLSDWTSSGGERWHQVAGLGESVFDALTGPLKAAALAKVREEAAAGAKAAVEPVVKNVIMISAVAGVISLVALYFSLSKR